MPNGHSFQHLPLILRERGVAKLSGGGSVADRTRDNRTNRGTHSANLQSSASSVISLRRAALERRTTESLPDLPPGIPLLLEVDPGLDIDLLRHHFNFEIVSEEESGFVIVASDDIDLSEFLTAITGFASEVRGTATIASVHRLDDDPDQHQRLRLILSERLFGLWPNIDDNAKYVVDIGVTCLGTREIPTVPEKGKLDTDATWARKESDWANGRTEAYDAWYDIQEQRLDEVRRIIVEGYKGSIGQIYHADPTDAVTLPDSFTMRVEVSGKGLKDFVLNFPFVFEVVEPDEITLPDLDSETGVEADRYTTPQPPGDDAPAVCVIDSGIQEEHLLLEPGIDKPTSRCFLPPPTNATDVADYVAPGGHGTRVAGAVLYGESIRREGTYQLPCWIQNARILDASGELPKALFPAALLHAVVTHFHRGPRKTRIFNHSINADSHCRLRHMSAWAAEIDSLCQLFDVLIVQSTGNLRSTAPAPNAGVRDHLNAGRTYPEFLLETSARVANPAQSLQAISVGSVAYNLYESTGWRSFANQEAEPSGFSRSGLGIWDVIKPEIVEFGGDLLSSPGTPLIISTPTEGRDCYPELVRSTFHGPGPAVDRDEIGTSFAAPKVTHIAAHLQRVLPDESCLLYRALIVQSARWPEWTRNGVNTNLAIRTLGYGIPDLERATTNTDYRTTLIASGETGIRAGDCDIFQVPIPEDLRRPGYEYDILVEVTLSYVAQPRRTRRNLRRYLSTWVDWKSSKLGESIEAFRRRALKGQDSDDSAAQGTTLRWTLGARTDHGDIQGAKRSSGTVQKDWAIVKSNELPEDFCIAVMGHEGWSKDPDSAARYALAVSFEVVGREIAIYDGLRVAVEELQSELETEIQVESD
ncbi:MAG: S8 family peptidase [Pirellulaceae bacterium]|nr:S8 family peptidase [Pirellulaceae bacterium]